MSETKICKFSGCPKRPMGPTPTSATQLIAIYSKVKTWAKCLPCEGVKYDTTCVIATNPSS
jgi:hypothetical protein